METTPPPRDSPKRVTLTAKQAADGFGRALCEYANNLLSDGKLDAAEAAALSQWLEACGESDLPALNFVREEVRRFAADGHLLPWELGRMQLALERILPPADRAMAKAARKKAEAEYEAREAEEPEESREAKRVRWERMRDKADDETVTKAQMKFIEDLGGTVSITASKHEASELISRLLAEQETNSPPSLLPTKATREADRDAKLKEAVARHDPSGQKIYNVILPARQPYEGRATLKQREYIWNLGIKDRDVIDAWGKRQASALIHQLKAQQKSGCTTVLVIGVLVVAVVTTASFA